MAEVTEEEKRQIEALYASIGRIAVHSEHLNHAMKQCCILLLRRRDERDELVDTALAGHNLESMRRVWVAMMKLRYRRDSEASAMVDHLSNRIDNVTQRRNDTIHRLWFIGYRAETDPPFEVAESLKYQRDSRERGEGGVRVSRRDSQDFTEIVREVVDLTQIVYRLVLSLIFNQPLGRVVKFQDGKVMLYSSGSSETD